MAHNRYRQAQPSGENTHRRRRDRPAHAPPGSRCCRSCAAPTRSRRCPSRRKALLPISPIYAPAGPARPEPAAHRAAAGRAAPAQPVPAALALGGADRAQARRAGGADGAQLPAGLLLRALLPRRPDLPGLPGPGARACRRSCTRCYRGLAGAERADGDHAGRAPGHLALGRPLHRAHLGHRRPPARLRHPGRADRGQAERASPTRARPRRSATASSSSAGSPRRRASACCWTPGGGTPTARSARCASPATASCARWSRRRPPSAPTCSYLGPLDRAGVRAAHRRQRGDHRRLHLARRAARR